jgi:predicted RNA-binding protein with TRAM domain
VQRKIDVREIDEEGKHHEVEARCEGYVVTVEEMCGQL